MKGGSKDLGFKHATLVTPHLTQHQSAPRRLCGMSPIATLAQDLLWQFNLDTFLECSKI
jgi:hypothetical protein